MAALVGILPRGQTPAGHRLTRPDLTCSAGGRHHNLRNAHLADIEQLELQVSFWPVTETPHDS